MQTYLVRSITRHTSRKDNTPLHTTLNKRPRRHSRTIEASIEIDAPQLVDFFLRELQRWLVFCASRVDDHPVYRPGFGDDLVNDFRYVLFLGYVGFERVESIWVAGGYCCEVVSCVADVNAVDSGGAVGEAAVCYAETYAPVCAGDYEGVSAS